MKHVMLDLETLGTGPKAAVVAIGACGFDPHGVGTPEKFYAQVSLASAMAAGLEVNAGTILWWMEQSDDARKQTFGGTEQLPLIDALTRFNAWLNSLHGEIAVWGNGATFDNVIIRSAYTAVGLTPAWHFRGDKCYRTVINLLPKDRRPEFIRAGTAHNALDDAITQALYLQKVYKELGL